MYLRDNSAITYHLRKTFKWAEVIFTNGLLLSKVPSPPPKKETTKKFSLQLMSIETFLFYRNKTVGHLEKSLL